MKHQKANLLYFNEKLYNISGIIPNDNINASLWKLKLFRAFQILLFLLYIFIATLQLVGLYSYWGDVELITDCLGMTAGFIVSYGSAAYFVVYWKDISKLFETFETNSIYCSEFVRVNRRHMKIVCDTRNFTLLLSKMTFLSTVLAGFVYNLPTFIHHLSTSDKQILEEIETTEGFTKYFLFVMWIPPVLKQPYVIRITYVLQVVCCSVGFIFGAAIVPLEYVLIIYTGTQFKLVSSVLREMDELVCRLQNPDKIADYVPEQMDNPDDTRRFLAQHIHVTKHEMGTEEGKMPSTEGQRTERLYSDNLLKVHDINILSGKSNDLSSAELTPLEENDAAISYLLLAIKLHQACIQ
jgi:hypothetical protein